MLLIPGYRKKLLPSRGMVARDTALFSIGLLPFILIAAAFVSMASILLFTNLTANDVTEILIAMGAIWLTVIAIMLFISRVCGRISPVELFTGDAPKTPIELFMQSFVETEKEVCDFVKKGDEFIKSDVGPKGDDNPALVFAAMGDARDNVDMVTCPPPPLITNPDDLEKRLKAMEATVKKFTVVQFRKAIDKMQKSSECFKNTSPEETFIDWVNRLKAVQDTLKAQKAQYLNPIEIKQKELQSGTASDCDKQNGANDSTNSDSMKQLTDV